jgi:hypothetical protein
MGEWGRTHFLAPGISEDAREEQKGTSKQKGTHLCLQGVVMPALLVTVLMPCNN